MCAPAEGHEVIKSAGRVRSVIFAPTGVTHSHTMTTQQIYAHRAIPIFELFYNVHYSIAVRQISKAKFLD